VRSGDLECLPGPARECSLNPPFSTQQFFDVFEAYNNAVWPAQLVLLVPALTVTALGESVSPGRHSSSGAVVHRRPERRPIFRSAGRRDAAPGRVGWRCVGALEEPTPGGRGGL